MSRAAAVVVAIAVAVYGGVSARVLVLGGTDVKIPSAAMRQNTNSA